MSSKEGQIHINAEDHQMYYYYNSSRANYSVKNFKNNRAPVNVLMKNIHAKICSLKS